VVVVVVVELGVYFLSFNNIKFNQHQMPKYFIFKIYKLYTKRETREEHKYCF